MLDIPHTKRTQIARAENLFQDFPRNYLPGIISATGLFHDWFLVGENPHISARTAWLPSLFPSYYYHIHHAYLLPVPAVLLVYLSLIPPGISGSAITDYSSSGV